MKKEQIKSFIKFIVAVILISFGALWLIGCEKEPEPSYTTVRKMHYMEGTYKGTCTITCDSLGINQTMKNQVLKITSFNAEELSLESFTAATAFPSSNEYRIHNMYWIDWNDCMTKLIAYDFRGTGKVIENTVTENGKVLLYYNGRKFSGDWHSKYVKQ